MELFKFVNICYIVLIDECTNGVFEYFHCFIMGIFTGGIYYWGFCRFRVWIGYPRARARALWDSFLVLILGKFRHTLGI